MLPNVYKYKPEILKRFELSPYFAFGWVLKQFDSNLKLLRNEIGKSWQILQYFITSWKVKNVDAGNLNFLNSKMEMEIVLLKAHHSDTLDLFCCTSRQEHSIWPKSCHTLYDWHPCTQTTCGGQAIVFFQVWGYPKNWCWERDENRLFCSDMGI